MKVSYPLCLLAWANAAGLVWALMLEVVAPSAPTFSALAVFVLFAIVAGAATQGGTREKGREYRTQT